MTIIEKNYSIHDIVKFRIVRKAGLAGNHYSRLDREYQNFETPSIDTPDFTVILDDFSPALSGCQILDDRYYIREGFLYCRDKYKLARWKVEFSGLEEAQTVVRLWANAFGGMMVSGFVTDPLIAFKLNEKGYPLIHASCVSRDDAAFVFTGRGGGGKTTIALYLVEQGFKFLGDNFTIVNQGDVSSFLSLLNVFTYNLAPVVKANLTASSKQKIRLRGYLYKMTLGYAKIFTKVNPREVFPESLGARARMRAIFLLLPRKRFQVQELGRAELIRSLSKNLQLDSLPFVRYFTEYSYAFPRSKVAAYWESYESNLNRAIPENIRAYRVQVPRRYDERTLEAISGLLEAL